MIRLLSTLFTLFLALTNGFSQDRNEIESAKLAVETLFFSDKSTALAISEEYIPKSKAINDTFFITYFLDQAGELNRFHGNLKTAESQLLSCLKYKKNWEDLKDLSITHNNLGKTYKMMGKFDLALEQFLKALKLMEISNNVLGQGYYLNNIGTLFDDQQNYAKAIEYYKRSYELKKETQDSAGMASTSFNVGITYFNQGKWDEALDYFYNSYNSTSYQKLPNKRIRALTSIGRTYIQQGKYDSSSAILHSALPHLHLTDDQLLTPRLYLALSEVSRNLNQLDSAEYFNALALENSRGDNPKLMRDILKDRTENFASKGDYESALATLKQSNLYADSLISETTIEAVANMEARFKTERNLRLRKEAEIEAYKAKETIQERDIQLLIISIIAIFLITVVVIVFIKYRFKRRNESLILGQKLLIENQNNELKAINNRLNQELKDKQLTIEEKEHILTNVFSKAQQKKLPDELLSLSPREMEVLAFLALGLTNDELAERLFVSKSTIKTHLQRIYTKLLVKNRSQAINIAHKYQVIGSITQQQEQMVE
jgi:ATP/maltotriose-dependent transcriptional regulator MalT